MGGGLCLPKKRGYYFFIIHFIYYFLFYANPLPSFIPRSLNLHNRLVEDCAAAEEEDVVEMEALLEEPEEPEEPEDLSESVVCKKNYEEPGPRGSAAHFLLGVEMEGDPPGNKNVEGGALSAVSAYCLNNINDSNKCQSSSTIDDDCIPIVMIW